MERLKLFLNKAALAALLFVLFVLLVIMSPANATDNDISYRYDARTAKCFAERLNGKGEVTGFIETACTEHVLWHAKRR